MKTKKLFSGLAAVVLSFVTAFACFGMTACNNGDTPLGEGPVTYTVTFNANGHGTAPGAQSVNKGEKANEPTALTDAEYDFGGWYKDAACSDGQEYDFAAETVTADITLYAKWTKKQTTPTEEKTYTVTFAMQGHGTQVAEQKVKEGGHAQEPTAPTDAEYDFGGWYKDAACSDGQNYNFTAETVTANITLYAKWTKKQPTTPQGDTSAKLTGKIYLVGDSTVCSFNDNYYIPRHGYGTQLYNYINCDPSQIINLAYSGRSSKSFVTDSGGNYDRLVSEITEGDYLIIGFGHNDEKSDEAARFTDPAPDYQTPTSSKGDGFQYTLYQKYVKVATEKGATPILCTPIVRYSDNGTYSGSVIHNTSDGDYAQAIRTLGEATHTTVIDLTTITKTIYESDNAAAAKFHAYTSYQSETDKTPIGKDNTHINLYGAKVVAYNLTKALLETDCPLKNNVKTDSAAPTEAEDYPEAINPKYVKPPVSAFDPEANAGRLLNDGFYKGAIGNIGGDKESEFAMAYADGVYTINNADKTNGKFEGAGDGFAFIFKQVAKDRNFKLTATATVKAIPTKNPNQAGFGLMLRDDVLLVDKSAGIDGTTGVTSNFLAAGAFADGITIFRRENAVLGKESFKSTVAVDATFEISIERIGQTVTLTFGDATKTFTDFDLFAVDNGYMYVGMFANRGFNVEFSQVAFEDKGVAQGA